MRDRLLDALGTTFRLEHRQSGIGKDKPHVADPRAPDAPSAVGLDRAAAGLLCALGALVLDIRDHVHATLPRSEDKDFSVLKQKTNGEKKSDPPVGRVALDAAGGPNDRTELHVQMAEGFVGHVTAIRVRPTSPTLDEKDLSVTITLRGVPLAISCLRFARPLVLELNDEVVLSIRNLNAAAQTVEYAVEGWLRREA